MYIETALTATKSFNTPLIARVRLSEDATQALMHLNSILSLNDEAVVEPGELHGMSRVLAHARKTWQVMRG